MASINLSVKSCPPCPLIIISCSLESKSTASAGGATLESANKNPRKTAVDREFDRDKSLDGWLVVAKVPLVEVDCEDWVGSWIGG